MGHDRPPIGQEKKDRIAAGRGAPDRPRFPVGNRTEGAGQNAESIRPAYASPPPPRVHETRTCRGCLERFDVTVAERDRLLATGRPFPTSCGPCSGALRCGGCGKTGTGFCRACREAARTTPWRR